MAAAFAATAVCVIGVAAAGIIALPLTVDGGFYSYPGFSWSLGRSPFANQMGIDAARGFGAFAAIFDFETASSVRLLYTGAWIAVAGGSHTSVIILSLLESTVAVASAYMLFRVFFERRRVAVLAALLLVTDKTLLLSAAADYRPDIAVMGGSCALLAALYKANGRLYWTTAAALAALVTAGTAVTAVIPLAGIFTLAGVRALQTSEKRRERLRDLVVAGFFGLVGFFGRKPFFAWAFNPAVTVSDPVDPVQRIASMMQAGPTHILEKEAFRFATYFGSSNLPLFLGVVVLLSALIFRRPGSERIPKDLWPVLAGLTAALAAIVLLDPHHSPRHWIPVMPLLLLLATKLERLLPTARVDQLLSVLILLSASSGIALGAFRLADARATGITNDWRRDQIAVLFPDDRAYLVIGPTELWPYFPKERSVVLADVTRDADALHMSGVEIPELDFVVLNRDYDIGAWSAAVANVTTTEPCVILDRAPHLVILAPGGCPQDSID